jgi:hypothetical protein
MWKFGTPIRVPTNEHAIICCGYLQTIEMGRWQNFTKPVVFLTHAEALPIDVCFAVAHSRIYYHTTLQVVDIVSVATVAKQ